jgi:Holliday junction resolvasome RuvABC endonuclease subunit
MTRLLAIDLAWDGPSGWVLWSGNALDPVDRYGEFAVTVSSKIKGAQKAMESAFQIFQTVSYLIENTQVDAVVYEFTDWHQNLQGKENWKKIYAQERVVQAALSRAETALLLACKMNNTPPVSIGARECKQEFVGSGRLDKENVAWTFKDTYNQEYRTRFELVQNMEVDAQAEAGKDCYLSDMAENKYISHHISDAFVIAYVVARRLHKEALVQESSLRQTKA